MSTSTILILRNGVVVSEREVLPHHDVIVCNGRIKAIAPTPKKSAQDESTASGFFDTAEFAYSPEIREFLLTTKPIVSANIIDVEGAYILPGMIDIHSDYVESVSSPRPSVVMDFGDSLYNVERELVAHGVTTIFHSLSVYHAAIFDHKPIRKFENVARLIEAIADFRKDEERDHLIRHRLHLRVEIDSLDRYEAVKKYVELGKVDLLSLMDHTPGQGQYADLDVFQKTLKGYRNISDKEIENIVAMQQKSNKLSLQQMAELSHMARERGISLASHDDDSLEKVALMQDLGASISEFPITKEVAIDARARGMHTLAGAPNVLMGHSHSGNLSAREAIEENLIDVLCSDYYPAAMLSAVFILHRQCGLDLAEAVSLVSLNPARAVSIDHKLGSISVGKVADLLVVREIGNDLPVVAEAFVGGRSVYRASYPCMQQTALKDSHRTASRSIQESSTPLNIDTTYSEKMQVS